MARPSDWHVVGLASDPVPGDPSDIRMLARKYAALGEALDDAGSGIRSAASDDSVSAWTGDAADTFREKLHRVPGFVATASDSMQQVVGALHGWADAVEDAQARADRALSHGRTAHADLTATAADPLAHLDVPAQLDAQSRLDVAGLSIVVAVAEYSAAAALAERTIQSAHDDAQTLFSRRMRMALQDVEKLEDADAWQQIFGSADDYRRFAADLAGLSPSELSEFLASLTPAQLAALSKAIRSNGSGRFGGGVSNWDRQAVLGALLAGADATQLARLRKAFAWAEPFHGVHTTLLGGLFDPTTPEWTQINQGRYGDCTWLASLAAATRQDPHFAEEHVRANPNGTVSVLLYDDQGHPRWITVTESFPIAGNSLMYAHGNQNWSDGPNWVTYYEKAIAQATDNSPTDPGATGTYDSFGGGNDPARSMPTITGRTSVDVSTDTAGAFEKVAAEAREGKLVTISTLGTNHSAEVPGYVPGHEFFFRGFDAKGDMIFGNPWGTNHASITVTPADFSKYFDWATVGS
jgi:uncharacterized protein YukE